ncbi:hypothetical protein [Haloferula sargassicola]|uniref:Uncharacterized protein n=1 Tax=Haloferula sargassicola TaxID=490096 RepID=A0ABP9US66_9BACT
MKTLVPVLMLAFAVSSLADEPGWTSEQRAEQRQVVVDATVTKIEKVRDQPTPKVELMRAVLEVSDVRKGKELLGGSDTIEVLYETSPLGAGYRCPTFPVLSLKQHGRFYLRHDEGLSEEKAFVLGMGRDVEAIPLDAGAVMPKLTEALAKNPSFDDLVRILGESRMDIGSGIHVFVYTLDQGPSITVGTPDKKKILYVDRGENRLYPIKAEQAGAGQPATRSESDSEGADKPQPEAEGRSR